MENKATLKATPTFVHQDVDLFKAHDVEQMLVLHMICVSPQESGQNLALQMIQWTEEDAKAHRVKVLTAESTGLASAKVFAKANYVQVKWRLQ